MGVLERAIITITRKLCISRKQFLLSVFAFLYVRLTTKPDLNIILFLDKKSLDADFHIPNELKLEILILLVPEMLSSTFFQYYHCHVFSRVQRLASFSDDNAITFRSVPLFLEQTKC